MILSTFAHRPHHFKKNVIGHEWNNLWDIDVGGVKWWLRLVDCE